MRGSFVQAGRGNFGFLPQVGEENEQERSYNT